MEFLIENKKKNPMDFSKEKWIPISARIHQEISEGPSKVYREEISEKIPKRIVRGIKK